MEDAWITVWNVCFSWVWISHESLPNNPFNVAFISFYRLSRLSSLVAKEKLQSKSHIQFSFLSFNSRQESQYEMTGLYSETQDDSSADLPQDTESESLPSTITVTTNFDPVQTQSVTVSTTLTNPSVTTTSITSSAAPDTVIKCHSRQPSSTLMDREKNLHNEDTDDDELSQDCGILSCRPAKIQKLARIKVRIMKRFLVSLRRLSPTDLRPSSFNACDTSTGA